MTDAEKKAAAAAEKATADRIAAVEKAAADKIAAAEAAQREAEQKAADDKAAADRAVAVAEQKAKLLEKKALSDEEEKARLAEQNEALKAMAAKKNDAPVAAKKLGEPFSHKGKNYGFKLERFALKFKGEMQNYKAVDCPEEVKIWLIENKRVGVIDVLKK